MERYINVIHYYYLFIFIINRLFPPILHHFPMKEPKQKVIEYTEQMNGKPLKLNVFGEAGFG